MVLCRPSIVDVGAVTDQRGSMKLALSGSASLRRSNQSSGGQTPNWMSRTSLLPNARSSTLVQVRRAPFQGTSILASSGSCSPSDAYKRLYQDVRGMHVSKAWAE